MVAAVAELANFSPADRDEICLAVGEACANIICHSYKHRPDGQIILRCRLEEDNITISIRDFGEKFDGSRVPPPDPAQMKPGGLGVHLIRSTMDKVRYDCSHDKGTEIHMTKYFHPKEA